MKKEEISKDEEIIKSLKDDEFKIIDENELKKMYLRNTFVDFEAYEKAMLSISEKAIKSFEGYKSYLRDLQDQLNNSYSRLTKYCKKYNIFDSKVKELEFVFLELSAVTERGLDRFDFVVEHIKDDLSDIDFFTMDLYEIEKEHSQNKDNEIAEREYYSNVKEIIEAMKDSEAQLRENIDRNQDEAIDSMKKLEDFIDDFSCDVDLFIAETKNVYKKSTENEERSRI